MLKTLTNLQSSRYLLAVNKMAFDIRERFPSAHKYFKLLDPGAYHEIKYALVKENKAPFLARSSRKTALLDRTLWTHAIYDTRYPQKTINCTSFRSKCPRFPYTANGKQEHRLSICSCGSKNVCACPIKVQEDYGTLSICQGKLRKRVFIGSTLRSTQQKISMPSKGDHGFEILCKGTKNRKFKRIVDDDSPIYDVCVNESTAYYRGCKWSQWTSKRTPSTTDNSNPGPTDYFYNKQSNFYKICANKLRESKRRTSKQPRYIEMVQMREVLNDYPGPANYFPGTSNRYVTRFIGSKDERFKKSNAEQLPGPADYCIKRIFDLPDHPIVRPRAKIAEPSFFGVKAKRFKVIQEKGPGPAAYNPLFKPSCLRGCKSPPFGSSSKRFKETQVDDGKDKTLRVNSQIIENICNVKRLHPTWEFKSKSIRLKPLKKVFNQPSPADLPQTITRIYRPREDQYKVPFFSSEGRFQPWHNWIPIFGKLQTPGPGHYEQNKTNKCSITIQHLCGSPRFLQRRNENPAPNQYTVQNGLESILATHNVRLRNEINSKKIKFGWLSNTEQRPTYMKPEIILLEKTIEILEDQLK